MKIYTGTGDRGRTSLFSGERVSKADGRVEAYGEVDELNSIVGALAASLGQGHREPADTLRRIQSDLFRVGAWLATTAGNAPSAGLPELTEEHARSLEQAIDRMEAQLPPLRGFILPGGHPSAAWAHVARTVCRRAERRVVGLVDCQAEGLDAAELNRIVIYLNRLSDFLFVLARLCNRLNGLADIPWES
ncbi:MAG: cob(I)yrinic acid a,c-diamide adenosyltransferase [bacterium]